MRLLLVSVTLLACAPPPGSVVTLSESDAGLAQRTFPPPAQIVVAAPIPPTPPALPTFGGCAGDPSNNCAPFVAGEDLCPLGFYRLPTSADCLPLGECVDTQPMVEGAVYVAETSLGASDGTKEHPFTSIAEAIGNAPDNALILVEPGTYRERFIVARGIEVRGACAQRTRIEARTALAGLAPIIRMQGGTLGSLSLLDSGFRRNGINIESGTNALRSLHVEAGDWGIEARSCDLAIDRLRARATLRITDHARVEASHLDLMPNGYNGIHVSGNVDVALEDVRVDGREADHNSNGIMIQPDFLAGTTPSAMGRFAITRVIIRGFDFGMILGGSVVSEIHDAQIEAVAVVPLLDTHQTLIDGFYGVVGQTGVVAMHNGPRAIVRNARLIANPERPMFVESQLQLAGGGMPYSALTFEQVIVDGFRGFGGIWMYRATGPLPPALVVHDATFRNLQAMEGEDGGGGGVVGPHVELRRVAFSNVRFSIDALELDAEDVSLDTGPYGVRVQQRASLLRASFDGVNMGFAMTSDPALSDQHAILSDISFTNIENYAIWTEGIPLQGERLQFDEMRGDVIHVEDAPATLSDIFISRLTVTDPEQDHPSYAIISDNADLQLARVHTELGSEYAGSVWHMGASLSVTDANLTGGYVGMMYFGADDAASTLGDVDISGTFIDDVNIGLWISHGLQSDVFRELRLGRVQLGTTSTSLPVPNRTNPIEGVVSIPGA